jgi:hypothetical protein
MRPTLALLLFAAAIALPACAGDPPPDTSQTQDEVGLLDTDADGIPDAVDLDDDGVADISLADFLGCNPLIDDDADGIPDGLDFDCDGVADFALDLPPLPPLPPPSCVPGLIDSDADGVPDGLDIDCDGVADFSF